MAKKHQIKVSSAKGRTAAWRSWRRDANESTREQITHQHTPSRSKKRIKKNWNVFKARSNQ